MPKCPVCGRKNETMLCSCGFDESLNYTKYPTLMVIGPDAIQSPPEKPVKPAKPTPSVQTHSPEPRKQKSVLIFAILVLILAVVLIMVMHTDPIPAASETSLPTMRTMASDCSTVLRDAGYSGAVLALHIQDQELNERFKVLTVTCVAEVWENDHQKQYVIELLYEYTDNTWQFSTLSNVSQ